MLQYQVHVEIDCDIQSEWEKWMREVHIPDVMQTGLFVRCRIYKAEAAPDTERAHYVFQYEAANRSDFERYQSEHSPALQKEHTERYEGRYKAWREILELLEERAAPTKLPKNN